MVLDPRAARAELARRSFLDFIRYVKPDYEFNWHHLHLIEMLDRFAKGHINKLMVWMPPQHGKSELCSRLFPAYILGIRPKTKVVICSYAATLAQSFNRDIQRIIDDVPYHEVFPDTLLSASNVSTNAKGAFLRNADIFEVVGHRGFVRTVGVGGALTGTPVDMGVVDDIYKDREEAESLNIRNKVASWHSDVFRTRQHNASQELFIMTRWGMDDQAARLLAREKDWVVVSFPAIKIRDTEFDPRKMGEVLWPGKHGMERIMSAKNSDPVSFESLYQQEPKPSKESLVFPVWHEYSDDPGYVKVYGLDFGFSNDPTALIETQHHNMSLWGKELLYEPGLLTSQVADRIKNLIPNWQWTPIIADGAEDRAIADLVDTYGIRGMVGAKKGPGSINSGITWLKDRKIHIHKDSHNLKQEAAGYQWIMQGLFPTNDPKPGNDHLWDAWRYANEYHRNPAPSGPASSFGRKK